VVIEPRDTVFLGIFLRQFTKVKPPVKEFTQLEEISKGDDVQKAVVGHDVRDVMEMT
jgi:hypothetical protein